MMKSITISAQIRWGIGNGFNNPYFVSRQTVLLPYTVQFRRNRRISLAAPGQKNRRDSIEYIASRPRYPVI